MEKKIKFSDKPAAQKIIYGAVIAILCISAVVVGILSASLSKEPAEETPPVSNDEKPPVSDESQNENPKEEVPEKLTLSSPTVGTMMTGHSHDTPVFSTTLEEWRVHTGIDISTADSAAVLAGSCRRRSMACGWRKRWWAHDAIGRRGF